MLPLAVLILVRGKQGRNRRILVSGRQQVVGNPTSGTGQKPLVPVVSLYRPPVARRACPTLGYEYVAFTAPRQVLNIDFPAASYFRGNTRRAWSALGEAYCPRKEQ